MDIEENHHIQNVFLARPLISYLVMYVESHGFINIDSALYYSYILYITIVVFPCISNIFLYYLPNSIHVI